MSPIESLVQHIDAEIQAQREVLVELCAQLVAARSDSPPGRTVDVAGIVRTFLENGGVATESSSIDPDAPNLIGQVLTGQGPHVVFNAHMDTMQPGDESQWSVPTGELTRRDGRLYGLGMGNMKGALAAMCVASTSLARHRAALPGRLTMTAVGDEVMFGDRGTVHLLAARPDVRGDYLISGEGPGHMHLAPAEKGLLWIDIDVAGPGGHSSGARTGETAVAKLAALMSRIDGINDIYADMPAELDGVTGGAGNLGMRVSLNVGTLASGGVRSLIAPVARAQIDVRLPPGIKAADIEQRIRDAARSDPAISVAVVKSWDANWTALDNPIVRHMAAATTELRGSRPDFVVRLPGSDARRWRDSGVPAVCYGPQPTLSSGVDDYADERDVLDCARAAIRLLAS